MTAMIDRYTNLDDTSDLPSEPVNLASRMRDLRTRQGLKQSEIARRMGLDPSIPSLWEQGRRPVPANRIRALADALEVPLVELLEGVPDAPTPTPPQSEGPARHAADLATAPRLTPERSAVSRSPLYTLITAQRTPAPPREVTPPPLPEPAPEPKIVSPAPRPPLVGWIPEGWEPGDRVADIMPDLADGYWLDPVRLERASAKHLLRQRLCAEDQALIGDREVPGLALAERIFQHCSKDEAFNPQRVPLVEAIFRLVLASDTAGQSVEALVDALSMRVNAVPVTRTLLRRLRDSVGPYPMRWVDRTLFF